MVRSETLFTVLLIAGLIAPVTAGAKENNAGKEAQQPINSKAGADDGGNKLGLDDDVKDCYVYAASGQIPKPYLRYRSNADKARMEAEATMLSLVPVLYSDEIAQFHDLNDDSATTFSMKAELFHLRQGLGARGCTS